MRSGPHGRNYAVKKRPNNYRVIYRFKVGRDRWKVIESDEPLHGDGNLHGYCYFEKRLIWLNAEDPPDTKLTTLLHELFHVLEYMTGKRVGHSYIEPGSHFLHQALEPYLKHLRGILDNNGA